MKIAVPTTQNNTIDSHFGNCQFYTIFTVSDKNVVINTEILPSPNGCGCKSNIATVLKEMDVTLLLAGNMGQGAVNVIQAQDIKVVRGCEGEINTVVASYLKGAISDSGETCDHHHGEGEEHVCNH